MIQHIYNLQTLYNEDALSYYLLGAFISDGNIRIGKTRPNRKVVSISSKDKDWIQMIASVLCPTAVITKHGKNCWILSCYSTQMADWFIDHGCLPNKSLTIQLPKVPLEYFSDFIRGLFDGDGSLSFNTKLRNNTKHTHTMRRMTLGTASGSFANSICYKLEELGFLCGVYTSIRAPRMIDDRLISKYSKIYNITITSGKEIYRLIKYTKYDSSLFTMHRKQKIATEIVKNWSDVRYCSCGTPLPVKITFSRKKYCDSCLTNKRRNYRAEL